LGFFYFTNCFIHTKLAKNPAFLFYPGDWLGGTLGMSFEDKGAYVELLMMQFTRGHMTSDMIGQTIGQIWGRISHKFKQDEEGKWYNERLDIEKVKRKIYVDSRYNNKSGKNQHSSNIGHMTPHMESENENKLLKKDISDDMWISHRDSFKNDGQWAFKFCSEKSLKLEDFDKMVATFISDIELKEDYKSTKELKRHFTNLYNVNKRKGSTKASKKGFTDVQENYNYEEQKF